MTTNEETKEELYEYVYKNYATMYMDASGILSSTCRQLALGIGSVTLLNKSYSINHPCHFKIFIFLLLFFFIFDALQYISMYIVNNNATKKFYEDITNEKIKKIGDIKEKPNMNTVPTSMFYFKLLLLSAGSVIFMILIVR